MILETMARRLERTKQESGHLQEVVSGTFSNIEIVKNKFDKYTSGKSKTINNLLEKLNNMEKQFVELENPMPTTNEN